MQIKNMNIFRSLFRIGRTRVHVGTDHLGNKYYEIPEKSAITTGNNVGMGGLTLLWAVGLLVIL